MTEKQIVQLMQIWGRNCVAKYRVAQECRKRAAELDTSAHPLIRDAWRSLLNIADDLERI